LNIDSVTGNQEFATSPNGLAKVSLELYTMTFKVTDYIFGSPLEGGTITITLPNGLPEKRQVQSGTAIFNQLPHASYPFTITRDFTLQVAGKTVLPNQRSISIKAIAAPSLVIILSIPTIISLFALKLFHARAKHREKTVVTTNDEFLQRWYETVERRKSYLGSS
jgi:hypothetical protein